MRISDGSSDVCSSDLLDVASGLHNRLRDEPALVETAGRHGRTLHDVRDPRPDIPIGNGKRRAGKRLLAVGTDCSVGQMYATLCLERAMHARGIAADFLSTGPTGILIAGSGVPPGSVLPDFVEGATHNLAPARPDDGRTT